MSDENESVLDRLEQTIGYGESTDESGTDHYFVGFSDIKDPETGSSSTSLGAHVDVSDTGIHADVAGGSFNIQGDAGGFTVGGFTASAEAVWDRDGYYGVGAQANILEGSVNYGNPEGDDSATDDLFLRGGLSEGVGAAARAYVGTDVDGDGVNEYGLGGDYLWGSGDVRVESETLTDAHAAAGEYYDAAAAAADDAYNYAAESASEAYESAATTANDAYNYAAESASEAYDTVATAADNAYNIAADTANAALDSASEAWDAVDLNPFDEE